MALSYCGELWVERVSPPHVANISPGGSPLLFHFSQPHGGENELWVVSSSHCYTQAAAAPVGKQLLGGKKHLPMKTWAVKPTWHQASASSFFPNFGHRVHRLAANSLKEETNNMIKRRRNNNRQQGRCDGDRAVWSIIGVDYNEDEKTDSGENRLLTSLHIRC